MSGLAPPGRLVRGAVARYLAGAVTVLVLVVLATLLLAGRIADREAREHAEVDVSALAGEYVVPLAAERLDLRRSAAELDDVLLPRVADGALRRVKVWADAGGTAGRIVYSDDPGLVGEVLPLDDEHALLATGGTHVEEVADQYGPGAYPQGTFEVYVGFSDGTGTPYIFEAYLPRPEMATSRADILRDWLPLVVGSLVLLSVVLLPLAVRLARRAVAAEAERSDLARRSLHESLGDRRRLAQRLHDGVVQDLSGVGLALDSVDRAGLPPTDVAVVERAAAIVRRQVRELRCVGDDLFPDAVSAGALRDAVEQLRRGLEADGVPLAVSVAVEGPLDADEDATFLVFRVVREAVRNVVRHAGATAVRVHVATGGDGTTVSVVDDGHGLRDGVRHGLGLRLLAHEVRERGGTLRLGPAENGTGAALRVNLP